MDYLAHYTARWCRAQSLRHLPECLYTDEHGGFRWIAAGAPELGGLWVDVTIWPDGRCDYVIVDEDGAAHTGTGVSVDVRLPGPARAALRAVIAEIERGAA